MRAPSPRHRGRRAGRARARARPRPFAPPRSADAITSAPPRARAGSGASAAIARSDRARLPFDRLAAARAIARSRPVSANSARSVAASSSASRRVDRAAAGVEQRIDVGEVGDVRPMQDRAGELGRLDRILPAWPARATCRRTRCRRGDRTGRVRPSCRRRRSPFAGSAARPRERSAQTKPRRCNSSAIASPRSGWRGAISVNASGNTSASAAMRLGGDALLALVGRGGDPDLPAGDETRRARPVPVRSAGGAGASYLRLPITSTPTRAEFGEPLRVALALREAGRSGRAARG